MIWGNKPYELFAFVVYETGWVGCGQPSPQIKKVLRRQYFLPTRPGRKREKSFFFFTKVTKQAKVMLFFRLSPRSKERKKESLLQNKGTDQRRRSFFFKKTLANLECFLLSVAFTCAQEAKRWSWQTQACCNISTSKHSGATANI